jgi:hypothetical protein
VLAAIAPIVGMLIASSGDCRCPGRRDEVAGFEAQSEE